MLQIIKDGLEAGETDSGTRWPPSLLESARPPPGSRGCTRCRQGSLLFSHQRQRLRHQVQVRQPVRVQALCPDGIMRATDVMVAGKTS